MKGKGKGKGKDKKEEASKRVKDVTIENRGGGSTINVGKDLVKDARKGTGVFDVPDYKGSILKDDSGNQFGIKLNDGKVIKTGSRSRKSMDEMNSIYQKDYKMWEQRKNKLKSLQGRASNPIKK